MSSFGRLADIAAALVLMFMIPAVWVLHCRDTISEMQMSLVVDELASRVSACGYIDEQMYEYFLRGLGTSGAYDVELVHTGLVYEPEYVAGVFTGNVIKYEEKMYTFDILRVLNECSIYLLDVGDLIEIRVQLGEAEYAVNKIVKGKGDI